MYKLVVETLFETHRKGVYATFQLGQEAFINFLYRYYRQGYQCDVNSTKCSLNDLISTISKSDSECTLVLTRVFNIDTPNEDGSVTGMVDQLTMRLVKC